MDLGEVMVKALIELNENTNRVINTIKARNDLKDKGAAIEYIVSRYIELEEEPDLKPEFIEKMKEIAKEPSVRITGDFREHFGL